MIVKRMLESNTLTVGGGAVEAAINLLKTRYQFGIKGTTGNLGIRRSVAGDPTHWRSTLHRATELVAKLRAFHYKSQTKKEESKDLKWMGLDLINGVVRDNMKAGVVEPQLVK